MSECASPTPHIMGHLGDDKEDEVYRNWEVLQRKGMMLEQKLRRNVSVNLSSPHQSQTNLII